MWISDLIWISIGQGLVHLTYAGPHAVPKRCLMREMQCMLQSTSEAAALQLDSLLSVSKTMPCAWESSAAITLCMTMFSSISACQHLKELSAWIIRAPLRFQLRS